MVLDRVLDFLLECGAQVCDLRENLTECLLAIEDIKENYDGTQMMDYLINNAKFLKLIQ
jgi:hypothetical protein